ncbi:unnamed protein product [Spirodela intermedia]|uniref:Uncharacterized protein n=2 Tax=Spirodela intermedia TaxID=51605 RepID=A0A7I8L6W2_SPIIN|nr:unnamed protein product [Spirodela intermedia]CAA6668861.1 unnamed protein product [Spirodela intermedia]CAA7405767.1 unnamed protein product [Spirodela intermedia]
MALRERRKGGRERAARPLSPRAAPPPYSRQGIPSPPSSPLPIRNPHRTPGTSATPPQSPVCSSVAPEETGSLSSAQRCSTDL